MQIKLEKAQEERNQAITKYEENETYWKTKFSKVAKEANQLFEMNKSLKEDNSDILLQLDKFNKRIKQLENEK